jgi:vancomycin resistance protein VanW
MRVWLTKNHLKGAIYTDPIWPYAYHVFEREHRFIKQDNKTYRANQIWRSRIDKRTGNHLQEELLITNFAEVKYAIDQSV